MTRLPTLDAAKALAIALRASLKAEGREISHSQALELIAQSHGKKDWNTLHAAIGNAPPAPVDLGQRVRGHFLAQPFTGKVTGIKQLSVDRFEVVLTFDQPVDVVVFDSFSNLRTRVTKVVGPDGRSFEKTSNGVPHLVIDL